MTPKEKAIELIAKFKPHVLIDEIEETPIFYDQKACAFIAVNEIIKTFTFTIQELENASDMAKKANDKDLSYWIKVKNEIANAK
jgi:hypothetical protein